MTNQNETLRLSDAEKEARYAELLPQLDSLLKGEADTVANLANFCALLHETFHWWWTGFYRIQERKEEGNGEGNGEGYGEGNGEGNDKGNGEEKEKGDKEEGGSELVLGPFQGPVACTRIKKGSGVCGTAWEKEETIVVDDVEQFPGHIACSAASRSEIVVPVRNAEGLLWGVLDIDSQYLSTFNDVDRQWLERAVQILADKI